MSWGCLNRFHIIWIIIYMPICQKMALGQTLHISYTITVPSAFGFAIPWAGVWREICCKFHPKMFSRTALIMYPLVNQHNHSWRKHSSWLRFGESAQDWLDFLNIIDSVWNHCIYMFSPWCILVSLKLSHHTWQRKKKQVARDDIPIATHV